VKSGSTRPVARSYPVAAGGYFVAEPFTVPTQDLQLLKTQASSTP
jgi:hypothetical protein